MVNRSGIAKVAAAPLSVGNSAAAGTPSTEWPNVLLSEFGLNRAQRVAAKYSSEVRIGPMGDSRASTITAYRMPARARHARAIPAVP
jgi:hypothetical protein